MWTINIEAKCSQFENIRGTGLERNRGWICWLSSMLQHKNSTGEFTPRPLTEQPTRGSPCHKWVHKSCPHCTLATPAKCEGYTIHNSFLVTTTMCEALPTLLMHVLGHPWVCFCPSSVSSPEPGVSPPPGLCPGASPVHQLARAAASSAATTASMSFTATCMAVDSQEVLRHTPYTL